MDSVSSRRLGCDIENGVDKPMAPEGGWLPPQAKLPGGNKWGAAPCRRNNWSWGGRVGDLYGIRLAVTMSFSQSNEKSDETRFAPTDPRSICNVMLDEAGTRTPLSNLALQKLLYFAHGIYLIENRAPLVSGYFEAWQYGPVHPAAYMAFKAAGDRPIEFRAQKRHPLTGIMTPIDYPRDEHAVMCAKKVVMNYARMTPGRLVEIAHAHDGPWDWVVKGTQKSMAFGLRIPDTVISERFRHHKVTIGAVPAKGEPREEAPFPS